MDVVIQKFSERTLLKIGRVRLLVWTDDTVPIRVPVPIAKPSMVEKPWLYYWQCPYVSVGDMVRYETLVDNPECHFCRRESEIVKAQYDFYTQGCCEAFKHLALLELKNGDWVNPGNTETVDCEECEYKGNDK